MSDFPSQSRYDSMTYRRCGNSGIQLPLLSLGLWHNFGGIDVFENGRAIVRTAFDHGITHLDLANNYGPPYGSAEETLGRILHLDLSLYRDELIISTKAGFDMWPGPYGNFGSRKYLVASLDQSLKRLGVDYVDIFYHHRPDPDTPLAETMGALDFTVRSGRALYVGISNYPPDQTKEAAHILRDLGTPCLIHQPKYNLLTRQPENNGLFDVLQEEGIGCIAFSILNSGMLTDKYLDGIPADSRAARPGHPLKNRLNKEFLGKISKLNDHACARGQTLAQMAIAWVLRQEAVTTALCGASRPEQIEDSVGVLENLNFTEDELQTIDNILAM
ncbi:MAG: aldo/keto reductase [Gemmatimonadetes bacterium]|nr:aldo/keto reductase [Gemmatimonadota bacterium]